MLAVPGLIPGPRRLVHRAPDDVGEHGGSDESPELPGNRRDSGGLLWRRRAGHGGSGMLSNGFIETKDTARRRTSAGNLAPAKSRLIHSCACPHMRSHARPPCTSRDIVAWSVPPSCAA